MLYERLIIKKTIQTYKYFPLFFPLFCFFVFVVAFFYYSKFKEGWELAIPLTTTIWFRQCVVFCIAIASV